MISETAAERTSNRPAADDPGRRRSGQVAGLARHWLTGWGALSQLILDLVLSVPYLLLLSLALLGLALLPALLIGAPLLLLALVTASALSYLERARLAALAGVEIAPPLLPVQDRPMWKRWGLDPHSWKALAHITLIGLWGVIAGGTVTLIGSVSLASIAVLPLAGILPAEGINLPLGAHAGGLQANLLFFAGGVVGLALLPTLARVLVLIDIDLVRSLLGPGRSEQVEQLSERVDTLTRTRTATVDSVEIERRRIERDLHDGPQQRLVAIAMDLGMAQQRIGRHPESARQLLDKAHAATKEAIVEMRMVARGIHPPILTDRGLDAALTALATRSPVPVTVNVDLPVRPSPTVEAIAYFCVSEALTNIAKHSGATEAQVSAQSTRGSKENSPGGNKQTSSLVLKIKDDGRGGADPARGTGLHGLSDRVRSVDGSLQVDSPAGGPTILTVQLPGGN